MDLIRVGWGRDNPAFRQIFTSRFIPGGSDDQLSWFNELCRKTTTAEVAAELLLARSQVDVSDQLYAVQAPTLVIHARDDAVCPLEGGPDHGRRHPRGPVRGAGLEEPHPARE